MRIPIGVSVVLISALCVGCSGSSNSGNGFEPGGKKDSGSTTGDDDDDGGGFQNGGDAGSLGPLGDGGTPPNGNGGCTPDPSFYDIPGDKCDNDGDGQVDNEVTCDTGLTAGGDAMAFAKAMGLCQTADATGTKWGVISATFTAGHTSTKAPAAAQHGILPKFGDVVKPQEGAMLGVISTGSATETDSDNGPQFKGQKNGMQGLLSTNDAPPGFPADSPGCSDPAGDPLGQGKTVHDLVNVKLQIRVPANAKGFSFDFDFWSGEWPEYVCSTFNDAFIAYLSSQGFNNGTPDNISFDAMKHPVSVNNGFFDRCSPTNATTGCIGGNASTAACAGTAAELAGTGFGSTAKSCGSQVASTGGATGWLTSQAPVKPGEVITLEFMIWDAGDSSWDSSVLLDHFVWAPNPVSTGTTRPPPPK